jgi:hypothetical protein
LDSLSTPAINPCEHFSGFTEQKLMCVSFDLHYDVLPQFLCFTFFLTANVLSCLQTVVYCLVREAPGVMAVDRIHCSLQKCGIAEFDMELERRVVPIRGTVWQQSIFSCIV